MNRAHVEVEKNIRNVTALTSNFEFMRALLSSILLVLVTQYAFGQQGSIVVISDVELDIKIEQKIAAVDTADQWGYRIQIYFGSDRKTALEVSSKFKTRYPELASEVYTDYFQPNWRVRVGNFYRKIDAQKLMYKLENEFGDVFLVRDIIELPTI